MFGKFFRRPVDVEARETRRFAAVEDGLRIYCVGDIHGRFDLLSAVTRFIEADAKSAPGRTLTIFVGDYIDRGPDSASVLNTLSAGDFPTEITALLGNHEQMLLTFLKDCAALEDWRRHGALESLVSYGVPVANVLRGFGYAAAQAALIERMPARQIAFLKSCAFSRQSGDYFFCHAGVRPNLPLADQQPDDLLWIRQPFLNFEGDFGKIVVHGHTRVDRVDIRANRINVDTGGFATGVLTCLVFEDDTLRLFETG